jgi:hypothetical protein
VVNLGWRASPRILLLAVPILLTAGTAVAENIDPAANGSQYAWAENLGWINLQPSGPGGYGVQVSDTGLTGWAWAENAGWISLSCQNTASCGANAYGVVNDYCGTLSGYAWSANTGWIDFAPTGAGVVISPTTGQFSGRAWSANAGWITFSSSGLHPYQVTTSWRVNCDDSSVCTNDSCNPGVGCSHSTIGCVASDSCHNPGTCDPVTGCSNPAKPDGASCDDGNACTSNETCSGGVCSGTCYCAESNGGVDAWWPAEGTGADISGGGWTGTPLNGTTFVGGAVGQAFNFDGVDDYVQVSGYMNRIPVSEVTVVLWQKADPTGTGIMSPFNAFPFINNNWFHAIVPSSDGKVYWTLGSSQLGYTPPVSPLGTWQHFAFVASQSGNYMRIYRNGVLEAQQTGMTPYVRSSQYLAIGGGGGHHFKGQVDELAIYNRALSASEIRAQYDAGSHGVCKRCSDPDGDGYGVAGDTCHSGTAVDCAPDDPSVWAVPGSMTGVTATKVSPPGTVRWAWNPATGGVAGAVFYAVGQSGGGQPATCVLSGFATTEVTESAIPAVGTILSYTGRAENACGPDPGSPQPDCP